RRLLVGSSGRDRFTNLPGRERRLTVSSGRGRSAAASLGVARYPGDLCGWMTSESTNQGRGIKPCVRAASPAQHSHPPVLVEAALGAFPGWYTGEPLQVPEKRLLERRGRGFRVAMRTPQGLAQDAVDHAQALEIGRGEAQRRRRLGSALAVAPP